MNPAVEIENLSVSCCSGRLPVRQSIRLIAAFPRHTARVLLHEIWVANVMYELSVAGINRFGSMYCSNFYVLKSSNWSKLGSVRSPETKEHGNRVKGVLCFLIL